MIADDEAGPATERSPTLPSRVRGMLLAGALGDALGAPVEFDSLAAIRARFGPRGVTGLEPAYGRRGAITDDTQMTLFTAEGLIRGKMGTGTLPRAPVQPQPHRMVPVPIFPPSAIWHAYLRWLHTQGIPWPEAGGPFAEQTPRPDGWLVRERWLHARRAPGNTCLSALASGKMGTLDQPLNDSKGCGGVMRAAPAGALPGDAFELGARLAAITHGHPTGCWPAGVLASTVRHLLAGEPLAAALDLATRELARRTNAEETLRALDAARELAHRGDPTPERVESLGAGWVAEEALAIAVYCALVHEPDLPAALLLAANHGGDSDSTAAICGNLLGALHGEAALPEPWLEELEGRETITALADDLVTQATDRFPRHDLASGPCAAADAWWERYPGW